VEGLTKESWKERLPVALLDDGCRSNIVVDVLRLARLLCHVQNARRSIEVHLGADFIVVQIVPLSLLVETLV
jgi:hypothetical protein